MNLFIDLTKRNIKLYWRDKSSVFTSLLSSIIIIALFILFLGKSFITNTHELFSEYGTIDSAGVSSLIFSWVLAGIIVLNSISIPQILLSRIIHDKESKTLHDFYVIPFKRSIIAMSYIASALLVGTVITFLSFLIGESYIYMTSGYLFSFTVHLKVFGIIVLCTTSFSSLMFLVYMFIKTSSTIGGITAFTSSVGGFLAGVYITIGGLSGVIKDVVSANPLAHATAFIRSILMTPFIDTLFNNVPNEVVTEFSDIMAVNLYVGNFQLSNMHYILSLLGIAIIGVVLSQIKLRKEKLN